MWQRRHVCDICRVANSCLASEDTPQQSSLLGSGEKSADAGYRRAWDGRLYRRVALREYDGCFVGQTLWEKAQNEATRSDALSTEPAIACLCGRRSEHRVEPLSVKRIRLFPGPRSCSFDQPTASPDQVPHIDAREVHNASHAQHTDHMMFFVAKCLELRF